MLFSYSSFDRKNKLHVVRGKKQPISGVRTRSGDLLALELVVASSVVPMPTLTRGKKIPADRLCKMLHVSLYICVQRQCVCKVGPGVTISYVLHTVIGKIQVTFLVPTLYNLLRVLYVLNCF